jgi:hypothetical protein
MNDNSITGIDTLTFTDVNGTIAGIENQNLVDKSASETIAGEWTFEDDVTIDKTTGEATLEVKSGDANSYLYINSAENFDSVIKLRENGLDRLLEYYDSSSGVIRFQNSVSSIIFMNSYDSGNLQFQGNSLTIDTNGDITKIGNNAAFQLVGSGTYPTIQFDTNDWIRLNTDVIEFGIGGIVEASLSASTLDLKENDIDNVGDISTETMTVEDTSGNSKFQIVYNSTDGTLDFNYIGA